MAHHLEAPPGEASSDEPDLLRWLDLEPIEHERYRGDNLAEGASRVFGGQVAGQALRAATFTVEREHVVHSLHGYFLRPGRLDRPIIYTVDRLRDGRSFTTRRVVAEQDGEAIFSLEASFHGEEPGGAYELPGPVDVVDPESLASRPITSPHQTPIDVRELVAPLPSTRRLWLRVIGRLPDDPAVHTCALVYLSDIGPVASAAVTVADQGPLMRASLDHTMWFHRPARADEWVLYDLEAVAVGRGRGLARGALYDRGGALVATVTQQALLRPLVARDRRADEDESA